MYLYSGKFNKFFENPRNNKNNNAVMELLHGISVPQVNILRMETDIDSGKEYSVIRGMDFDSREMN